MVRSLFAYRPLLCMLIICCALLQSCAGTQSTGPAMKIGMHIDAVLEFAVEYPLSWGKARRLANGGKEGEVRWTEPGQAGTLLRIKSYPHDTQASDEEQQIDRVLHEYAGMTISQNDKLDLPAGQATHIQGQTARQKVDLYLFLRNGRNFVIVLTTASDNSDHYEEVMDRVTNSFQILDHQEQ